MSAFTESVYDVLVEACHAVDDPDARRSFAFHWPECGEYRFYGHLGFGGKVWCNRGEVYVTCYPGDQTPERKAMIEAANARLSLLVHAGLSSETTT